MNKIVVINYEQEARGIFPFFSGSHDHAQYALDKRNYHRIVQNGNIIETPIVDKPINIQGFEEYRVMVRGTNAELEKNAHAVAQIINDFTRDGVNVGNFKFRGSGSTDLANLAWSINGENNLRKMYEGNEPKQGEFRLI